jgi:hypothetical protein
MDFIAFMSENDEIWERIKDYCFVRKRKEILKH